MGITGRFRQLGSGVGEAHPFAAEILILFFPALFVVVGPQYFKDYLVSNTTRRVAEKCRFGQILVVDYYCVATIITEVVNGWLKSLKYYKLCKVIAILRCRLRSC